MKDEQLRIDLAAAHRLAYRLGLSEGLSNHFSARLVRAAELLRGSRAAFALSNKDPATKW